MYGGRTSTTAFVLAAAFLLAAVGREATAAADASIASPDTLEARLVEMRAAGRFPEALAIARSLAEARRNDPDAKDWEIAGAEAVVETIAFIVTLPEEAQSELGEAYRLEPEIVNAANGGEYDRGVALGERQLEICERFLGEDHLDVAASLDKLASLYRMKGKFALAEPAARRALAIRRAHLPGDHPSVAHTLSNLGVLLSRQGQLAQAEEAHREALAIRRRSLGNEHEDTAESLNNLALAYGRQGDDATAETLVREVLALEREHRGAETPMVALALSNLAYILAQRGRHRDAEPLFREALALRRKLLGEEHPYVARSMQALAACLYDESDYARAEPLYRRALDLKRRRLGEDHPEIAVTIDDLARLLSARGDVEGAEPLHREALAIRRRAYGEEHIWIATSLHALAANLAARGQPAEAEGLFREALAMRRKLLGEEHAEVASSLEGLGHALSAQGNVELADARLNEALAMRRRLLGEEHPDVARNLEALAGLARRRRDFEGAERLYREALAMHRHLLDRPSLPEVRTREAIAECVLARGELVSAERLFAEAAESFESARLRSGSGLARATTVKSPYVRLATTRLELGMREAAWPAAEKALGRVLGDLLLESRERSLDPDQAAREDSLKKELRDAESSLAALERAAAADSAAPVLAKLRDMRTRLLSAEAAWVALQEEIALAHPVAAGEAFSLGRVQAALCEDAAILGWVWDEGSEGKGVGWGYVIRDAGPVRWEAVTNPELASEFHASLARTAAWPLPVTETAGVAKDARRLWDCWVSPLTPHLEGVTDLVIIPSGPMAGVPVEVLVDDRGGFLADAYAISYIPSATIYAWQREARREQPPSPATRHALLVGDPPFSEDHLLAMNDEEASDGLLLAAADIAAEPALLRSALAGNAEALENLPRLPGTRAEIEVVTDAIPDALVLLGPQAAEAEIVRLAEAGDLRRFDTIHIATHALVDEERPERSALVLSRAGLPDPLDAAMTGTRAYDGLLTMKEIVREWDLEADLVTLSACQTALGREIPGEGHVGLAHALLRVGARSLLVSLWKVRDEATLLLMGRFYENLTGAYEGARGDWVAEPMPKNEALREAKIWLRSWTDSDGRTPFRHPAYWSGFVLFGEAT
jgi:CHAT domain-containing protein/Flp pilus assembly protein TadD